MVGTEERKAGEEEEEEEEAGGELEKDFSPNIKRSEGRGR